MGVVGTSLTLTGFARQQWRAWIETTSMVNVLICFLGLWRLLYKRKQLSFSFLVKTLVTAYNLTVSR
jgi:hypothetical protein